MFHLDDRDAVITADTNLRLSTRSRIRTATRNPGRVIRQVQCGEIYLVKVDGKKESIFGIDVDSQDDCKVALDQEGNPDVSIYGSKTSRVDMVDFMEERYTNHLKGKSTDKRMYFSGLDFDKDGKII